MIVLDNLEKINETLFENIKHIDEYGNEYWFARELMHVLEYDKWNNFHSVIKHAQKAKINAEASKINDFTEVGKIVQTGALSRKIIDYRLSRYACYLIAMNGDPRKKAIALAQTYFAVKTRQQELSENFEQLTEDQKRLGIRQELAKHNTSLSEAAHNAGITSPAQYATFQNAGYRGLYGGLTENDIHKRKNLKPTQKILDHMGSTELAANLFRATQTDEKLRRDNIHGVAKDMKKLLYKALNPDGLVLVNNYGITQVIKHYHLHIIPAYKEKQPLRDVEEVYNQIMEQKN